MGSSVADGAAAPCGLCEPGIPSKTARVASSARAASPAAVPDIYGPGAVLTAGNVYMKVTNYGVIGNPYTELSSDPSGQWPGPSGVEYLNAIVLAVGAVNPQATDPTTIARVSSGSEWRPPTLDPVDRIYSTRVGVKGQAAPINDDRDFDPSTGEPRIDEDLLNGRDDDGDGRIDEDGAALGDLMYSWTMRDDTPAALAAAGEEPHVPLGLECRQRAWAYSSSALGNFDVIESTIVNRAGHVLDSMYVGSPADLDAGSVRESAGYFIDDADVPFFPSGEFAIPLTKMDPLFLQGSPDDRPPCSTMRVRINGFSVVDRDGDGGRTPGVASVL